MAKKEATTAVADKAAPVSKTKAYRLVEGAGAHKELDGTVFRRGEVIESEENLVEKYKGKFVEVDSQAWNDALEAAAAKHVEKEKAREKAAADAAKERAQREAGGSKPATTNKPNVGSGS